MTVPRDERWGRSYEGFSEDPTLVAELGAAAVRGLQGTDLADPLRVLGVRQALRRATAARSGARAGATSATRAGGTPRPGRHAGRRGHAAPHPPARLRRRDRGGRGHDHAVLHRSWNGEKCSGSKRLLTEILKDELGFEGFLISDYNAIDQLPGDYRSDIKQSINAGMDMVMVPEKYQEFITKLKSLVEAGKVPMPRIDDAVRRILRVKFAMGLKPGAHAAADKALQASFGSAEHRAVARRAVRESLVLLKNDKQHPAAVEEPEAHPRGRQARRRHRRSSPAAGPSTGRGCEPGKPQARSRARRSWPRSRAAVPRPRR